MKPDLQTITSIILDEGYYAALPTIGPSMYPVIRAGDKIYVESLMGRTPETGDIVLFKSPSPQSSPLRAMAPRGEEVSVESSLSNREEVIMVCHRLLKIFKKDGTTYYQTRGDAYFYKDIPITYDQIIGRVVKVERSVVSLPRKFLLTLNPFLGKFTILNAAIITVLVWIKKALVKNNHLFIGYF